MSKQKINTTKFTLSDVQTHLNENGPTTNALTRTINALRCHIKPETLDTLFKMSLKDILGYRNIGPKGILALLTYFSNNFEFNVTKEDVLFCSTVKILSPRQADLLSIQDMFLKIGGHEKGFDEKYKQTLRRRVTMIDFKIKEYNQIIENYKIEREKILTMLNT